MQDLQNLKWNFVLIISEASWFATERQIIAHIRTLIFSYTKLVVSLVCSKTGITFIFFFFSIRMYCKNEDRPPCISLDYSSYIPLFYLSFCQMIIIFLNCLLRSLKQVINRSLNPTLVLLEMSFIRAGSHTGPKEKEELKLCLAPLPEDISMCQRLSTKYG